MAPPAPNWQEMVEHCASEGLLAKQLYVVFTRPAGDLGPVMEHLEEHLAFQHDLEARGIMFGAGPFPDASGEHWGGEGMVIIRAGSKAEAEEIASSDPMHRAGARTFVVRPWLLNEGTVTLKVTYSDGGREII